MSKMGFVGFPDTKMKPVIVPDLFFSDLLPQIEDLGELKLTLHCFWLLNEQDTALKYLRGADLRYDMEISLEQAYAGAEVSVTVPAAITCDACDGSGAKPGVVSVIRTAPDICARYRGRRYSTRA